ncbi:MAG: hypothetical protein NTV48_00035 [Candidatus Vogelbacteria bacterium]|nr:hypothetical protein [Candidatus Vogelbacteria bacterium]
MKGWSLEEAWEKAEKAAGILQLSDPVQGLIFTLEAARVEARQKAECSSV